MRDGGLRIRTLSGSGEETESEDMNETAKRPTSQPVEVVLHLLMVRSRVERASLWKVMMMLVGGRSAS